MADEININLIRTVSEHSYKPEDEEVKVEYKKISETPSDSHISYNTD